MALTRTRLHAVSWDLRIANVIPLLLISLGKLHGAYGGTVVERLSHEGNQPCLQGFARQSRLLVSSGVVNVSNGDEFIAALMHLEVNHMILSAPIVDVHPDAWKNVAVELPILITRNVTSEGNASDWPLLRLHYVKDVVRLQGNVTWMLRFVFIDGTNGENIYREQGFSILAPTLSGEWSEVLIGPAALSFRFCFPLEYQQANLQLTDRPARYPGPQQMLFNCTQTGCANGSAVPPLRRCWMAKGCMVDVAGVGVRVDPTSDQPVPTNTYFRMSDVSGVCEYLVDYRCLLERQSEPLVCYMNLVNQYRNDTTSFLDDYQPQIGQEKWILSVTTPPPPPLVTATQPHGSGNRSAASMVGASVAGAVIGSLLLLATLAAIVLVWRRRQQRRMVFGSNQAEKNTLNWRLCNFTSPRLSHEARSRKCTDAPAGAVINGASDAASYGVNLDQSDKWLKRQLSSSDQCLENIAGKQGGNCCSVQVILGNPAGDLITPDTKPKPNLDMRVRLVESNSDGSSPVHGTMASICNNSASTSYYDPATTIVAVDERSIGQGAGAAANSSFVSIAAGNVHKMDTEDSTVPQVNATTDHSCGILQAVVCSSSIHEDRRGTAVHNPGGGDISDDNHYSAGGVVELSQVVRGKGAFGRVVEGMYGGQRVAVKLLASDGPWGEPTETFIRCFAQELQVLSRCEHPNVVRLLAACVEPPRLCLVLELMETSLERLIHGDPTAPLMPLPKVLHIAISIANALAYLHPTIMHRDLKPANVLINDPQSDRPLVKLTDFGLARLRVTVAPTAHPDEGTPAYMAPECFDLEKSCVTHQADIFSLGVLLWEMLTGKRPWAGLQNPLAVALRVAYNGARLPLEDLDPQRCPQKLARLINACWERDPARRPAAAEAAKELTLGWLVGSSTTQQIR